MTTSFTMFPTASGILPHTMLDTVFGVLHRLYDQFLFAWMLFITACRKRLRALLQDDSGIGTIELVLILVVLIAAGAVYWYFCPCSKDCKAKVQASACAVEAPAN